MSHLQTWAAHHHLETALALLGIAIAAVLIYRWVRWLTPRIASWARRASAGAPVVTLAAIVGTSVSLNTNWLFFGEKLHVTHLYERIPIFAFGEIALIGTALMARTRKLETTTEARRGSTGWYGKFVWVISSASCIPAFELAGLSGGLVRALFGPLGAAVMWHMALDIELTVQRPESAESRTAKAARQLRERFFARLGLADIDEDSSARLRRRAIERAADLVIEGVALQETRLFKNSRMRRLEKRLKKALLAGEVYSDKAQKKALMGMLAVAQNAHKLINLQHPSPWTEDSDEEPVLGQADPGASDSRTLAPSTTHPATLACSTADPRTLPPEPAGLFRAAAPGALERDLETQPPTSEYADSSAAVAPSPDLADLQRVHEPATWGHVPQQRVNGVEYAAGMPQAAHPAPPSVPPFMAEGPSYPSDPDWTARLEPRPGAVSDPSDPFSADLRTLRAPEGSEGRGPFGLEGPNADPAPPAPWSEGQNLGPEQTQDETEDDFTGLAWSPATARIAREIVAMWRANRVVIKRAELLAAVRERGGKVSNGERTNFYAWAIDPAQPGDESAADSELLDTADAR